MLRLTIKPHKMLHSSKYIMLKEYEILSSLNTQAFNELAENCTFFKIPKGLPTYKVGDKVQAVYFLQKGSIKIGCSTIEDKQLIKNIVYPGELFGENVFSLDKRTDFAVALEDCQLFSIPLSYYNQMLVSNPALREAILNQMLKNLKTLQQRRQNFVFTKAKNRIMGFIKDLADKRGIKIGIEEILVNHKLSHKEIANITDTSRQTVARVLSELKDENIIHFSPRKPTKILIRDIMKLT